MTIKNYSPSIQIEIRTAAKISFEHPFKIIVVLQKLGLGLIESLAAFHVSQKSDLKIVCPYLLVGFDGITHIMSKRVEAGLGLNRRGHITVQEIVLVSKDKTMGNERLIVFFISILL